MVYCFQLACYQLQNLLLLQFSSHHFHFWILIFLSVYHLSHSAEKKRKSLTIKKKNQVTYEHRHKLNHFLFRTPIKWYYDENFLSKLPQHKILHSEFKEYKEPKFWEIFLIPKAIISKILVSPFLFQLWTTKSTKKT